MSDLQSVHGKAKPDWRGLAARLTSALRPVCHPIAVSFLKHEPAHAARLDDVVPEPNEHGRTGKVSAGCVFWMKAVDRTFSTVAGDHANCSVGSYTHGFLSLDEMTAKDDVGAVLEAGWLGIVDVRKLPTVVERPRAIVYGPLAETSLDPDVVLVRINALALMILKDAYPELLIEGKPQCHIVVLAKESGRVVASVGCILSRTRTGMRADELSAALPGVGLAQAVERIEAAAGLDRSIARFAASDARRFA